MYCISNCFSVKLVYPSHSVTSFPFRFHPPFTTMVIITLKHRINFSFQSFTSVFCFTYDRFSSLVKLKIYICLFLLYFNILSNSICIWPYKYLPEYIKLFVSKLCTFHWLFFSSVATLAVIATAYAGTGTIAARHPFWFCVFFGGGLVFVNWGFRV